MAVEKKRLALPKDQDRIGITPVEEDRMRIIANLIIDRILAEKAEKKLRVGMMLKLN